MNPTDGPGVTERELFAEPVYRWDPQSARLAGPPEVSLRELTHRVLRRRRLLAAIAATAFVAIAVYTFVVTPRYSSEARLRIDTESQGPAALAALSGLADKTSSIPGASLLGLGRDELETEIAVLKSDRISDAMIDSLALNVQVTKPAADRASVLSARIVQPDVDADGKVKLRRLENGRYAADWKDFDETAGLPAEIIPGATVRVGGTAVTLAPALRRGGPSTIAITFLPRYKVHKLLEKRLLIEQEEGGSRLVDVTYEDPDRRLAAQVVAVLIHEYVDYTTRTSHGMDTLTVARLRFQVDSTSRALALAETALRDYATRSGMIVPQDQASAEIKRLGLISAQVDAISTERNALVRMLEVINERSRGGTDPAAYRQLATFPSLITNRAIQDLLQTLVDLENKRAQLGVSRTETNAEYKGLTDRIQDVERQLGSIGPQYLESLDQELAMTARTATAVTDTLDAIPAAALQYARLLRSRTVLETTYVALQKQLKASELQDVLRQDKVQIVDHPRVANRHDKAFPHKVVMLLLGAVLSIALALAVGLFAELWWAPEPDVLAAPT